MAHIQHLTYIRTSFTHGIYYVLPKKWDSNMYFNSLSPDSEATINLHWVYHAHYHYIGLNTQWVTRSFDTSGPHISPHDWYWSGITSSYCLIDFRDLWPVVSWIQPIETDTSHLYDVYLEVYPICPLALRHFAPSWFVDKSDTLQIDMI